MPRLTQTTTLHLDLVAQIKHLESLIQSNRRDNLGYAREIGDRLRTVPSKERPAVAREAGIGRSSYFEYVQISEHWSAVADCASIREARRVIRRPRVPCSDWLPFDGEGCAVRAHR